MVDATVGGASPLIKPLTEDVAQQTPSTSFAHACVAHGTACEVQSRLLASPCCCTQGGHLEVEAPRLGGSRRSPGDLAPLTVGRRSSPSTSARCLQRPRQRTGSRLRRAGARRKRRLPRSVQLSDHAAGAHTHPGANAAVLLSAQNSQKSTKRASTLR